ncbi:ATP-binding protein [Hyunsoonleella sp. SJ7]|uniref:ATP-binding protein n=1 Tax=Hyunsoonleella aquatilis TaxID=2762758 RepID=A0A923HDF4_9FLAO|nr:ATP-binding protein [Hyunsoonleella aquatilis]MBC3759131.1 ATP-binding protein [Hyunsoonleella aquatilis]
MKVKKVVITGGPGTGKSSIINELEARNHICFKEISRQITLDAQKEGVDQLFLTNPLLFSELLLKGRIKQFKKADHLETEVVFFDRGIPDVLAYMNFVGDTFPKDFVDVTKQSIYDTVFILKPWRAIYKSDNERYENFEQSEEIYKHLLNTYSIYNYKPIDVPFGTVEARTDFILKTLHLK